MKNVLGTDLKCCGTKPVTGYFRDGFCRTTESDQGRHVVASVVDEKFLVFSRQMGNDLSTPNPMYNFPGLKPGDKWCVCALRWKEALDAFEWVNDSAYRTQSDPLLITWREIKTALRSWVVLERSEDTTPASRVANTLRCK